MSVSAPTLLREWELLQSDVIPPLLANSSESPTAWAMGSIDDAVALAVAFQHAQQSAIELPSGVFAARGHGELDVIDHGEWRRRHGGVLAGRVKAFLSAHS